VDPPFLAGVSGVSAWPVIVVAAGPKGYGGTATGAVAVVSALEQRSRWIGTSRRASAVALYVYDPTDVDVTASEMLRLSRLEYTPADGYFLKRHGDLLRPGTTRLRLDVGVYHFKSLRDVQVRIHRPEVVRVLTSSGVLPSPGVHPGRQP